MGASWNTKPLADGTAFSGMKVAQGQGRGGGLVMGSERKEPFIVITSDNGSFKGHASLFYIINVS